MKVTTMLKGGLLAALIAAGSATLHAEGFTWGNANGVLFQNEYLQNSPLTYLESTIKIYYQAEKGYNFSMYSYIDQIPEDCAIKKDGVTVATVAGIYSYSMTQVVNVQFSPSKITEPGNYTLTIPANCLRTNSETVDNPKFEYTFEVVAAEEPLFTTTPASDADLPYEEPISRITLKYKKDFYVGEGAAPSVTVDGPMARINGVSKQYDAKLSIDPEDAGIAYIDITPQLEYEGNYTITVGDESLINWITDEPLPGFELHYTITGNNPPEVSLNPSPGSIVKSLDVVRMTFPTSDTWSYTYEVKKSTANVLDASGNVVSTATLTNSDVESETNVLLATINPPITYSGTYTLDVADGAIVQRINLKGIFLGGFSASYIVDGEEAPIVAVDPVYEAIPAENEEQTSLYDIYVYYMAEDLKLSSDEELLKVVAKKDGLEFGEYLLQPDEAPMGGIGAVKFYATDNGVAITEGGTYTFTIKEGAVMNGEVPFKGVTLTYRVTVKDTPSEEINYTVTPDPNETWDKIEGPIVITFPDFVRVSGQMYGSEDMGCGAHITGDPFYIMAQFDGNKAIFPLNETILAKGTYTFATEDTMIGYKEDGTTVEIPAPIMITYNVSGTTIEPVEIKPVITPAEGEVQELQHFSIVFEDATTVTLMGNYGPNDFPALYRVEEGQEDVKAMSTYNVQTSGNEFSFSLQGADAYSVVGTYKLVIPKQLLFVNGEALEEDLVFNYVIKGSDVVIPWTYTITPASGTEMTEFTVITTTLSCEQEGVTFSRKSMGSLYPKMYLVAENGEETQIPGKISGTDNMVVWAPYNDIMDQGSLRYVIPAGYFVITDAEGNINYNEDIVATYVYKTSGLHLLLGDGGQADVYTAGGVCVGKSLDAEAVKALPSGLYIINGAKVILK